MERRKQAWKKGEIPQIETFELHTASRFFAAAACFQHHHQRFGIR